MISDLHVRIDFSGDSSTPAKAQIARAIHLSMPSPCVTDHHDYDVHSGGIDSNLNLEEYLPAMELLQQEYTSEVQLFTGMELGLQPHLSNYFDKLSTKYSLDFITGSTHSVNGLDLCYPQFFGGREKARAYEEHFKVPLQNVKIPNQSDVADHIDYIVRYGPSKNRFYRYKTYEDLLEELLETIISKGKGIKCNTAGFQKGLKQPNPHPGILRRYRELGGEIVTVGSDTHAPDDPGTGFEPARRVLLTCSYRRRATCERRKPIFHRLS